jgi:hypothetical protein
MGPMVSFSIDCLDVDPWSPFPWTHGLDFPRVGIGSDIPRNEQRANVFDRDLTPKAK